MFRYRDNALEPVPRNQLRSTDQDFGVDYGAYGFTFDVRARKGAVLVIGMQICSADGCPYDYSVYTNNKGWRQSYTDAAAWSHCGGDTRVYIPDYGHGEYGHLPWTPRGVLVEAGSTQSFYIFSNNDPAAVGYRLVGHRDAVSRKGHGDDHAMPDASPSPSNLPPVQVTDHDDNLEILSGQNIRSEEPFRPAKPDDLIRAFLGIIEYEVVGH